MTRLGSTAYFVICTKLVFEAVYLLLYVNVSTIDVFVSCLSDLYDQEMGVLLGAILSVNLFILKINSSIKCLPVGVRGSLYVNDFCICFRSKSLIAIERQIQQCINSIQKWADENAFQSMSELFSKVASRSIIDFIKETGCYLKFKCMFYLNITCQSNIVF